jgi:RecA-family ATPase
MRRSAELTERLSVVQVAAVESAGGDGMSWLVEGLWEEEGVGILGGAPKSCKSWLALDVAFSVATGTSALGKYEVRVPGPVLIFAAEDQPQRVRSRLEGFAACRGQDLERIPLHLIVESALRLDTERDQSRLAETVGRYRPRLLVLDPFVRLHRIDENSAQEVSRLLAYLRELQREHHVAIFVVHHSRKAGAAGEHVGLSLRGSGDFHAWGESNLYLRRRRGALELAIEQRNAAATEPIQLALRADGDSPPHLEVVCIASQRNDLAELKHRVVQILTQHHEPKTQEWLRAELRVRLQRLQDAVRELEEEGAVKRTAAGCALRTHRQRISGEAEMDGGDTSIEE